MNLKQNIIGQAFAIMVILLITVGYIMAQDNQSLPHDNRPFGGPYGGSQSDVSIANDRPRADSPMYNSILPPQGSGNIGVAKKAKPGISPEDGAIQSKKHASEMQSKEISIHRSQVVHDIKSPKMLKVKPSRYAGHSKNTSPATNVNPPKTTSASGGKSPEIGHIKKIKPVAGDKHPARAIQNRVHNISFTDATKEEMHNPKRNQSGSFEESSDQAAKRPPSKHN